MVIAAVASGNYRKDINGVRVANDKNGCFVG
jgi:hypothetical protein